MMSASETLDNYIKQFKNSYAKYLPSETGSSIDSHSVSSIDTDELLSGSSESEPPTFKSLSSLKRKKRLPKLAKLKQAQPLHSTPLKMIHEEEEFEPGKNGLGNYLTQIAHSKQHRIQQMMNAFDSGSDLTSMCSSIDTDALLEDSSEEEETRPVNKRISKATKNTKKHTVKLEIEKTSELGIFKKQFDIVTTNIGVKPAVRGPSAFFNSVSSKMNTHKVLLCSCVMAGSLFKHRPNCRTFIATVSVETRKQVTQRALTHAALKIQKFYRKYIKHCRRVLLPETHFKSPGGFEGHFFSPLDENEIFTARELEESYKQHKEFLLSLKARVVPDDVSDCDTEELLNS